MHYRRKRIICYSMCFLLMASFWSLGPAFGGDPQDKLDEVHDNINQTQAQLNKGKKEAAKLTSQIEELEAQINKAQKDLDSLQNDMGKTRSNIGLAEQRLKKSQESMTTQNSNMNDRLVAMYKSGDMSMLKVLLSSSDFSEFMSNLDMMQRIYESDMDLLKTMEEQHKKIELQRKELLALQEKLMRQQREKEAKQDSLEVSRGTVADKKSEVTKNNAALSKMLDDYNRQAAALEAEIRALQGDGVYAGGPLGWPAPGYPGINSKFGMRKHPILNVNKLHTGIDIKAPKGTTVVAAADGEVIKAEYNRSYGNVVMIDHGSRLVTLYAHNTSLLVKKGDVIKRGTPVAISGSTGMSTGPHLHFEVRENGKYVDPMKYFK